jgi:hypothetical protein
MPAIAKFGMDYSDRLAIRRLQHESGLM